MTSASTLFISLAGGLLPALLWLWFWLQEDRKHPEPRRKIMLSFLCGMLAVILVLPIEKFLFSLFGSTVGAITLISWAIAEESLKFGAAYFSSILKNTDNDERIDPVIYLISAALGFSALENSFFLLNAVTTGVITQSIINGNMRFIGATLLHTASSATIGIFMAFGYFKDKDRVKYKADYLYTGLLAAFALHAIFNWLIIKSGESLFFVFGGVWIIIISLMLAFEKIKSFAD